MVWWHNFKQQIRLRLEFKGTIKALVENKEKNSWISESINTYEEGFAFIERIPITQREHYEEEIMDNSGISRWPFEENRLI